jgi:anti-anti-sigma factor
MEPPVGEPGAGGRPHLEVEVLSRPPLLYVLLSGDLDMSTVGHLPIHAATPPGTLAVVVDLGGLTFCGIKGVRGLLALRMRHLAENRRVHFVNVNPHVRRLFEVAGEARALDRMR